LYPRGSGDAESTTRARFVRIITNVKLIISTIVGLIVLTGIGAGVWLKSRNGDTDATAVRVEAVSRGDLVELVTAPGTIQAKTKVSISARVAARIVELPFRAGERVTRGNPDTIPPLPASVLIKLDSKDLDAQLRAAQARADAQAAQIDMARAQLEARRADIAALKVEFADAQRELKRQNDLLGSRDVSQQAVDQAQTKADQLQAGLDSAVHNLAASDAHLNVMEHQLRAAQADILRASDNLSYTTITSPIDGVVTKLNAEVGELVMTGTMNNAGTVIMEVADLGAMLLLARVDESSVASLKVGQKAVVRIPAFKNDIFDGVVESVALANTEEKDGTKFFKTEVLIKNGTDKRILSGLTGEVDIETNRNHDVLTVPSQAVLGRPVDDLPPGIRDKPEVDHSRTQTPVVYRFVDGKAIVTPVRVGPSDIQRTTIESGLSEGDIVIVGPYKALEPIKHDDKVKDEKTATTQPSTQKT
jgi:HlyD family secretion protein